MKKLFLTLMLFSSLSFAEIEKNILIKEILGTGVVQKKVKGTLSVVHANENLSITDQLITDAKATANIVYPDGSEQSVGPNSQIQIQDFEGKVPSTYLEKGTSVIQVPKGTGNSKGHKFYIRTNTAVMGVRGTIFVVDVQSKGGGRTVLHTLEGQVEIAASRKGLISGQGVAVRQNEMIQAGRNNIGMKSAFNPTKYMNQLQAVHPMGMQMIQRGMQERGQKMDRPDDRGKNNRKGDSEGPRGEPGGPQQGGQQQDGSHQGGEQSPPAGGEKRENDRRGFAPQGGGKVNGPGNGGGPALGNSPNGGGGGPGQGGNMGPGQGGGGQQGGNGPGHGSGNGPGMGGMGNKQNGSMPKQQPMGGSGRPGGPSPMQPGPMPPAGGAGPAPMQPPQ